MSIDDVNKAGDGQPGEEDWVELWSSLSESAKEEVKKIIEDAQWRRQAQELKLWGYLWVAAPEETKERLRSRWKAAKIPPR